MISTKVSEDVHGFLEAVNRCVCVKKTIKGTIGIIIITWLF